jgi:hypothetical protein
MTSEAAVDRRFHAMRAGVARRARRRERGGGKGDIHNFFATAGAASVSFRVGHVANGMKM